MLKTKIHIPLTVPWWKKREYKRNFYIATRGTGRLFMFACDQKVEHLNDDFVGKNATPEMADPEHFFKIAKNARIGVLATQLGLLSRYGRNYPNIPYFIKLNSKTNILKVSDKDPLSNLWYSMDDIIRFKHESRLPIVGVGYTVYIGSWYESDMFRQAAEVVLRAHREGLLTTLWMYPRGRAIENEKDPHLIAGGAGVAACLGADFVKLYCSREKEKNSCENLQEAVIAAGRCGVICVGGPKKSPQEFLRDISTQVHLAHTRGAAVGRNIWQRPLDEAVRMANAIAAIIYDGANPSVAYRIFQGKNRKK